MLRSLAARLRARYARFKRGMELDDLYESRDEWADRQW